MAEDQNNSNNAGLAQDAKPTAPRNDNAGSGKTFAETQRDARDVHQLSEAVADAGLNAFGAVFVEVWVMSHDGTKLQRPPGGNWMDPAFGLSFPDEESMEAARALDIEAIDCAPGAGLAGTLFEESASGARRVYWRQIKSLMDDPFVQRGAGRRMERLFNLGIGLVAAVPFNFQDQNGLVLFFSRSTANVDRLRAPSNERYLIGTTDLIGATHALQKPRKECAEMRRQMFREAIEKVRVELRSKRKTSVGSILQNPEEMKRLKEAREKEIAEADGRVWAGPPRVDRHAATFVMKIIHFGKWGWRRVNNSRRKWGGAKLHGPPRQSLSDCLFAFTGVFVAMLMILKMSTEVNNWGKTDKWNFDGAWYSSSLCIVYALTPAPVGQPRQIFAAHFWNMLVGMAVKQIPDGGFEHFSEWSSAGPDATYGLPLIWKQSLAVAIGVSGQAFIGILHPPATGLSFAFATHDKWSWGTMVSVFLADLIMVVFAMMYINVSEKKQFPLYWLGLGWSNSEGSIGEINRRAKMLRTRMTGASKKKGEDAV